MYFMQLKHGMLTVGEIGLTVSNNSEEGRIKKGQTNTDSHSNHQQKM